MVMDEEMGEMLHAIWSLIGKFKVAITLKRLGENFDSFSVPWIYKSYVFEM